MAGAKPRAKDWFLPDGEMEGLWLRIYPSGKKIFVLHHRDEHHRRRQKRLGEWPSCPLAQARLDAHALLGALRSGAPEVHQPLTFRQVAEEYLDLKVLRSLAPKTLREYRRSLERDIYPHIGMRAIRNITPHGLADVLSPFKGRPYWNRILPGLLRPIFSYALRQAYTDKNPALEFAKIPEVPRKVDLSREERLRLLRSLDDLEAEADISPDAARAVRLLMATGCRTSEILGLQHTQIDAVRKQITWDRTKSGPKIFPLTPTVEALLSTTGEGNEVWVFPSPVTSGPRSTIRRAFYKVRTAAELPELHVHDLRHLFGATSRALSDPIVAKDLLGLRTFKMAAVYAATTHEELMQVGEATARAVLGQATRSVEAGNPASMRWVPQSSWNIPTSPTTYCFFFTSAPITPVEVLLLKELGE
ncbi:MAG: tyrosine-type recombinase/integrase [Acidobacteria bacterium]|nr:tyrosine-type recombinase/integrase [Acidobacteriota bacterium]